MSKLITLQSGVELKITLAPFSEAKELYQALLKEIKDLKLDPEAEIDVNFFKDIFCSSMASKQIEEALKKCLQRCIYGKERIVNIDAIFESEVAREDYVEVCFEVARANVMPFTKNLYAQFSKIKETLIGESPV